MSSTNDTKWLDDQVAIFKQRHATYRAFADTLEAVLKKETDRLGIIALIQARAKSIPSFAEKCIRKKGKYVNPADQLTDLCGARIIVESRDQVPIVREFIEKHFDVDQANSVDTAARLNAAEFGYQSVHYVVSFKEDKTFDGVSTPKVLTKWRTTVQAKALGMVRGPIFKAEIQVRTLLQHAWASLVHDNIYKSDFKAPPHMVRIATRTAAILEESDNSFLRLLEGVRFYNNYYGAYMTRAQNEAEIAALSAVKKHDPYNPSLAHKIARHAMAVEAWETVVECLKDFEADEPSKQNGILRDLAIAKIKLNMPGGLELLDKAVKENPNDADALCELGDALRDKDRNQAGVHYKDAYRLKPSYPRALRSYIISQIQSGTDPDLVMLVRPNLEQAIAICREWAATKVYLPLAHFDAGFFCLLLGDKIYESLDAYAKASVASETRSPILEACCRIEEVQDAWVKAPQGIQEALQWTHAFLLAAVVAKIHAEAVQANNEARRIERELGTLKNQLAKLHSSDEPVSENAIKELRESIDKRKKAQPEAEEKSSILATKDAQAVAKYLANTDFVEKRRRCLASEAAKGCKPPFERSKPVIVVAGGCNEKVAQRIDAYKELFQKAFEGFTGTLVSGGTTAGIGALVGDMAFPNGAVDKVAYLPEHLPNGDQLHTEYEVLLLPGTSYTPMGPVQVWIDILASGIAPESVRLIGLNGGDLSAFEYRLALAMGAKVGVLRDSGREATKIADDPAWRLPNLLPLPTDLETLRLFINPPETPEELKDEDVLTLAKQAHETYRAERGRSLAPAEPGLCDWDHLLPHIQESNRQQAANIEAKLKRVGLAIRKVEGRDVALYPIKDEIVIEMLAELEHARWNMERLLDGWTPGERDPVKKTSPYLVPWNELSDNIKKYDRDAVADTPVKLAKLGYEVYKPERATASIEKA